MAKKRKFYFSKNQYCEKCLKEKRKYISLYKVDPKDSAMFCKYHGYTGECVGCSAMDFEERESL